MNYLSGILVNTNFGRVTDLHVGQLGFTIIRQYPLGDINERDYLRARRYKLSLPNLSLHNGALARCVNFRVAEIHHSCRKARLFRMQIGLKLQNLRLEDYLRTPLGFGTELAAAKYGLSLIEIGIAAGKLC